MASILRDIVAVYPHLSPASVTAPMLQRIYNILTLLRSIVSHSKTRGLFVNGPHDAPKRRLYCC